MHRSALRTALVAGGTLLLVAAGFLRVQAVRLNEELAHAVFGTIMSPVLTGDGSRVVYLANLLDAEVQELFVSPSDGSGGALRLNATQVTGGDVQSFLLAPGEERVLYRADQDVDGVVELYSVPVDGSLAPVKLNGSLTPVPSFAKFSPDGTRALFLANNASGGAELYSVPMDGSQTPVKLNGTIFAGGSVRADKVAVSPDGTRVLYMAPLSQATMLELFSVPLGGGTAVKLNGTLVTHGDLESAAIGPASDWVAYTADQLTNNVIELFGVPLGGGTAVRLNATLASGSISLYSLAAASGVPFVVYRAQQDVAGRNELYAAPADGSQPAYKLNAAFASGSGVTSHALTPDGVRVVYLTSAGEVFGAPVDGSQPAARLDSPRPAGVVVDNFTINEDGSRVVYWTRDTNVSSDSTDIYAAPTDGSASAILLSAGLPGNRVPYSPLLGPEGTHLAYLRRNGPSYLDLYGVPIDGSASPVKLNGALFLMSTGLYPTGCAFDSATSMHFSARTGSSTTQLFRAPLDASSAPLAVSAFEPPLGGVTSFQLSADRSRVLFTASELPLPNIELFCAASDGETPAVRVNDPLPSAPYQGDVTEFVLTSDASTVVYAAPQDTYGYAQLYAVPSDGSAAPLRLEDELGVVSNLVLTPDGESVLYLFRPYSPFGSPGFLRLARLDGSQPPVEMTDAFPGATTPLITPDGARALVINLDFYQDGRLYSLRLDGSGVASFLGDVDVQFDLALSPDGSHVFYRRGGSFVTGEPTETELWVSAVDGSGAPTVLNDPLPEFGEVSWFRLTPDGERVVYRADQNGPANEIFSTASDGSGPSTRLNGTLVANGSVLFAAVAKSGPYVVYVADQTVDGRNELYCVPNDGSSAPVKLNPTLVSGGDVITFVLSLDGEHAVYIADQVTNDVAELFSVALDGGSPAVRISAPMVTGGDVTICRIAPDSSRVVYLADQLVNNKAELFGVALTGGPVVRLNSDLVSGGNVSLDALTVSADSRWVVYQADANVDGVNELFRARIDRAGIPERLNGPLVQGGGVGGVTPPFRLGPDGETVVFAADQLQNDVFELFSAVSKPFRIRQR